MATVVGQASAAATSVAIPAHQVGDLIIVAARGTAAAPVKPAAGGTVPAWDTLQSALANTLGLTTVAFVATATNHTTGVFTSATHICVLVLRPAAGRRLQTAAARSATGNGNNTQTIIYPALTLASGGGAGTSAGVRIGTRGVADSEVGTNIPSGWTNQSIQPAGASALMAVHTRLALAANPTADSIATAGTNAAYRAHTVEVEEVLLITDLGGVAVAGDATLAMQADRIIPFASSVAGVSAVLGSETVLPPPITFAIDLLTNQPYAGEHDAGEFLAGVEPLLALDLSIERFDFVEGGIAGVGAITAQVSQTRGVAASVAGSGAVTALPLLTRGMAGSTAGQAALSADLEVTHQAENFVLFNAAVQGQAAVAPALSHLRNVGVTVAGQAVVAPSVGGIQGFGVTISRQAAVSAQADRTRGLAASVSGTGVVTTNVISVVFVFFACEVKVIPHICGQWLAGQMVVGGIGPRAYVNAQTVLSLGYWANIQGKATVSPLLLPSTSLNAAIHGQAFITAQEKPLVRFFPEIQGKANISTLLLPSLRLEAAIEGKAVVAPYAVLKLAVGALIVGKATIVAQQYPHWFTTEEEGGIWTPTDQEVEDWVPSIRQTVSATPTTEEDLVWIPSTERSV